MAQEISLNILLGIVSGFIATFLTIFFRSYWQKVLLPWYEERIYKDAHIEGRWDGELKYSDNHPSSILIFYITRKSHSISGQMLENGKIYNIEGEFRNMILTLTYCSTVSYGVDRGCFTFLLVKSGKQLDGSGAIYYSPDHKVTTASIKLNRVDLDTPRYSDGSTTPKTVSMREIDNDPNYQ